MKVITTVSHMAAAVLVLAAMTRAVDLNKVAINAYNAAVEAYGQEAVDEMVAEYTPTVQAYLEAYGYGEERITKGHEAAERAFGPWAGQERVSGVYGEERNDVHASELRERITKAQQAAERFLRDDLGRGL